jgi:hypothetical protein
VGSRSSFLFFPEPSTHSTALRLQVAMNTNVEFQAREPFTPANKFAHSALQYSDTPSRNFLSLDCWLATGLARASSP